MRGARPPHTFTGRGGETKHSGIAAAVIFVEKGEHIIIRRCILHDSCQGLFVSHGSREILVEGCWIYDNGLEPSAYVHNSYTEAAGIIFQYNHWRVAPRRPREQPEGTARPDAA